MQTNVEFYVLKLCKGLGNLGILSLIRGNPSLMKSDIKQGHNGELMKNAKVLTAL